MLIVTNLASSLKSDFEAVVKSEKRVPIPTTTSASFAITLAERLPVTPTPPRLSSWEESTADLPFCVSAKGMLCFSQNFCKVSPHSEYLTPPPAITRGFFAALRISAISAISSSAGAILVIL